MQPHLEEQGCVSEHRGNSGDERRDMVMESIMEIEKMDTIIFLLIQGFDFFLQEGQIMNSLSFVGQTIFATTAPLFYKATMDRST